MRTALVSPKAALLCVAFGIFAAAPADAHDVVHTIAKGNAVVVNVGYEGGEAMRYASVMIYSPRDKKVEFQNGRTDARGNFAFVPDTSGEWKIVVDDENAHGFVATFTVGNGMAVTVARGTFAWIRKILLGIAMLFGLFGIAFYFRAQKMLHSK